jgi:hypothetical protein
LNPDAILRLGGLAIAALTYAVVIAAIYIGGGADALRRQWRVLLLLFGAMLAIAIVVDQASVLLGNSLFVPLVLFLSLGANVVLFVLRRNQSATLGEEERERRRARLREVRGRVALLIAIYVIGVVLITFLTLNAAGSR